MRFCKYMRDSHWEFLLNLMTCLLGIEREAGLGEQWIKSLDLF